MFCRQWSYSTGLVLTELMVLQYSNYKKVVKLSYMKSATSLISTLLVICVVEFDFCVQRYNSENSECFIINICNAMNHSKETVKEKMCFHFSLEYHRKGQFSRFHCKASTNIFKTSSVECTSALNSNTSFSVMMCEWTSLYSVSIHVKTLVCTIHFYSIRIVANVRIHAALQ